MRARRTSHEPGQLRRELRQRLLATTSELPATVLQRIGRTAMGLLRVGRLARGGEPDLESLTRMVTSIGQLKGVAMKVGQIMSYVDVALPEELRAALSVLQTASPAMPIERVLEVVTAELGERAPSLLARMEPVAVAAASIGQVHRAWLDDGTAVAVKVRYPEISDAIASDFRVAGMGTQLAGLFYPGANVQALAEEARERFLLECDYRHEADLQARFAAIYAGHPTLRVPEVHLAYCSERVLTTSWADGMTLDQWLAGDPPQADRDRIGVALFEFYVGTLYRHGLYNCDPHPGNYVFQRDGGLVMLDYGCTRAFERDFVAKLTALKHAVDGDRRDELHHAFVALGMVRDGQKYDFATARALVRGFYGPMLEDQELQIEPGAARTLGELTQSKRELMRLSLPGEFLFLLRIRFGLMSILARLGARANWFRLERGYLA
jgi:predicted unusual protein kinase regulating ubiquinone biosynthesis (AarF/ABC1/UbiB family)